MKLRIYFQIALQEAIPPSGLGCPLCPHTWWWESPPRSRRPLPAARAVLADGSPQPARRKAPASHRAVNRAELSDGKWSSPCPATGVWTEICSSHNRVGESGCIRARRPPQCHRGDLPCVPRVRRGCERAVLCGLVCCTFSWAHGPAHWSSAHRHLHGHPARVPQSSVFLGGLH